MNPSEGRFWPTGHIFGAWNMFISHLIFDLWPLLKIKDRSPTHVNVRPWWSNMWRRSATDPVSVKTTFYWCERFITTMLYSTAAPKPPKQFQSVPTTASTPTAWLKTTSLLCWRRKPCGMLHTASCRRTNVMAFLAFSTTSVTHSFNLVTTGFSCSLQSPVDKYGAEETKGKSLNDTHET